MPCRHLNLTRSRSQTMLRGPQVQPAVAPAAIQTRQRPAISQAALPELIYIGSTITPLISNWAVVQEKCRNTSPPATSQESPPLPFRKGCFLGNCAPPLQMQCAIDPTLSVFHSMFSSICLGEYVPHPRSMGMFWTNGTGKEVGVYLPRL